MKEKVFHGVIAGQRGDLKLEVNQPFPHFPMKESKEFPETIWAHGQERRTEFCCCLLSAWLQPAPAFKELVDEMEGRAAGLLGGFPGEVSGTTRLGWGPENSPCSDSRDVARMVRVEAGEVAGSPWNWTTPTPVEVSPHVPPFIFFHYIQIRSAINFIKNKAGQRMGPPDRAVGVWGGGTRESRGGLWLQS